MGLILPLVLGFQLGAIAPAESRRAPTDSLPIRVLLASRIRGTAPRVDGRMTEALWAQAQAATGFVQSEPDPGAAATEATEIRVLYTPQAIYIGARMHDSRPDRIAGRLARRDEMVPSDWLFVYLDSDADGATAYGFGVNPRGVRRDFLLSEAGTEDSGWDAVWDVAVTQDTGGWTAEFRIPLTQLRFNGGDADTWGVNFERHIVRKGEVASWAQMPRNRRRIVSSFGQLEGLAGLSAPLRLEVVPYTMARLSTPDQGPDGPRTMVGTAGADLKLGVTRSLTLSGSFNPDFGQVEADAAVVNVSGYRTFFPEKRPLFLEDARRFERSIGPARIFHSRRIGRTSLPTERSRSGLRQVPDASGILAATKLSGRTAGGWSIGLLHALTNAEGLVTEDSLGVEQIEPTAPRTNFVVARLVRDHADRSGRTGGMVTTTHRALEDGLTAQPSGAVVAGLDWMRRFSGGATEISAALYGSHVRGEAEAIDRIQTTHGRYLQRPDASHLHYDPARTALTGFAAELMVGSVGPGDLLWNAGAQALSPGFEVNDLGYQPRADEIRQFASVGFDRLRGGPVLRRRRLVVQQWSDWTFGRERVATGASADLRLQFANFWGVIGVAERHLAARSPDLLRGGPALATPPSNRFRAIAHTDPRAGFQLRLDGSHTREEQTGGEITSLRAAFTLRPAGSWEMTLEPTITRRAGLVEYITTRPTADETHYLFGRAHQRVASMTARVDVALSPALSLQGYAQPYLTTRGFSDFLRVDDALAAGFGERFQAFESGQVTYDPVQERYSVDATGDGTVDYTFPNPDFTYSQLSSNLVLRWEYRPGSTLFAVWSRDARARWTGVRHDPLRDPGAGLEELIGLGREPAPATNLFVIKASFWVSW